MRRRNPLALAAGLAIVLGVSSVAVLIGVAVTSGQVSPAGAQSPRTIEVSMTDGLRFDPDRLTVASGETVRFVITNPTRVDHEFVIGDTELQRMHAGVMASGMMQDDAHAVSVPAGQMRELIYTFGAPGVLQIGCHVPGHYEAGMVASVTVTP